MNLLDAAVVAVAISAIVGGYRLGLLRGAVAWILLIQGLVLATVLLPGLDHEMKDLSPGVSLGVEVAVFLGAGYAGVYIGRWMGTRYRHALLEPAYEVPDRIAGAVLAPVAVIISMWLLVMPAFSQSSGLLAGQVRESALSRAIDDIFPPPPDTAMAFHRLVGPAGAPQVFASLDPFLDDVPPPAQAELSEAVVERVAASTVRVEGVACRRRLDGSGFTVAPNVVVTNAHVVAGQGETEVIRHDGTRLPAVVTAFDADRDLAVLQVPDLDQAPLSIGDPETRETGAVFGYPGGEETLDVSPALIRRQISARGADLYYDHTIRREVLILAVELQPGDSGAPLVDTEGNVVGVAFAVALDRGDTAYALSTTELRSVLEAPSTDEADTGECLR
ncbi:MAG TPA: MarP family serine protease [Acidimicrobiales bacterium]|nr:MarP family serine protease [Acidimicrobiales bacterium]